MKKILPIILSLALLSGCGAYTPKETENPDVKAEPFAFTAENFPQICCATPAAPMAEGALSVLLGQNADKVLKYPEFASTDEAYISLAEGRCDLAIAPEPGPSAAAVSDKNESAAVCRDALVFIVNASNPVSALDIKDLRGIYSGRITDWKQVGGREGEISAFQREDGDGMQSAMLRLIMDGKPAAAAPEEEVLTDGGTVSVVKSFDGSAGAIGYCSYFYARKMLARPDFKILAVDGVLPDDDTIASGEYALTFPVYAVIRGDEADDSPARVLWQWLQDSGGRRLAASRGYIAAKG